MSREESQLLELGLDEQIEESPDYEDRVGYKMPPKEHRWRKGMRSPNPGGRPRRKMTRKYYLERVACRIVTVNMGQWSQQLTALEAVVLTIKNKAIAGNQVASRIYDKLQGIADLDEGEPNAVKGVYFLREKMSVEDWAIAAAAYQDGQPTF